ncbi:MAG: HNH endonuclease signature motif containing protein [Mycolicibacterium sp.]|uniref:HNH endonuclease signature motif containing protein n=1 Tax=Mycolicibacterium sp. TaxID=2320850 RepID=UPI003D103B25
MPALEHRALNRLTGETEPRDLGASSWRDVVTTALRVSKSNANRRLREAANLGPRRAMTGQPLPPVWEATAAAQARGLLGAEHVAVIAKFHQHLPGWVDVGTREVADAHLADLGGGLGPEELDQAAGALLMMIDQDGPAPSEDDHARKRGLNLGRQQRDGMTRITGWLDPEARATWEAVLAKSAAPGMCNPDDDAPCVDGDPGERAQRDLRTQSQRQHDAFKAVGRWMLASGRLGQHNGLPVTVIVSTTLQELESGVGLAVTGGGSRLPMRDVIRLAAHAHHYLAVFDKHTNHALYLGRTKRCASPAQRIVLHARDRGCTRPGCAASGYDCQVHHAVADWKHDGRTDIDDLTLACGPDNRLVDTTAWRTRRNANGRTEWIPPPDLDTGRSRVNGYHHPERYLLPDPGENP